MTTSSQLDRTLRQLAAFVVGALVVGCTIATVVDLCGCGSRKPTIPEPVTVAIGDVIDCAKIETFAAAANTTILDVAQAVTKAIDRYKDEGFAGVEDSIGKLFIPYGEPLVACVVAHDLPGLGTSERITTPPGDPVTIRRQLVIIHQWRFR